MSQMLHDYADSVLRLCGAPDGYYAASQINDLVMQFPPPDRYLPKYGLGIDNVPIIGVDVPLNHYIGASIVEPIKTGDLGFHPCFIDFMNVQNPDSWGEWVRFQDWLKPMLLNAFIYHTGQGMHVRGHDVAICCVRLLVEGGHMFSARGQP